MSEDIYKIVELAGTSKTNIESAVQNALSKASQTIRNIKWFQITDTRGYIENNRVSYWQGTLKIGFNVDQTKESAQKPEPHPSASQEKSPQKKETKDSGKYRCTVCGYIYDPGKGDPDSGIKPGTPFEDIPDDWVCPECGVSKDRFEKI